MNYSSLILILESKSIPARRTEVKRDVHMKYSRVLKDTDWNWKIRVFSLSFPTHFSYAGMAANLLDRELIPLIGEHAENAWANLGPTSFFYLFIYLFILFFLPSGFRRALAQEAWI